MESVLDLKSGASSLMTEADAVCKASSRLRCSIERLANLPVLQGEECIKGPALRVVDEIQEEAQPLQQLPPAASDEEGDDEDDLPAVLRQRWSNKDHFGGRRYQMSSAPSSQPSFKLHGAFEELSVFASEGLNVQALRANSNAAQFRMPSGTPDMERIVSEFRNGCSLISNPHAASRLVWAGFGLLFVCYDAIVIPVMLAWDFSSSSGFLYGVFVTAMAYWSTDIPMSFCTAFYDNGLLVRSPAKIARRYMRSWFMFDVTMVSLDFTTIAFPNVAADSGPLLTRLVRLVRAVRCVRLLRLIKMTTLTQLVDDYLGQTGMQALEVVLAVAKSFGAILFVAHCMGCAWFLVGRLSDEFGSDSWLKDQYIDQPFFDQYVVCIHWMLGQFTPAPVDIHPRNTGERIFTVFVILFAVLAMGACLSRISTTLNQVLKASSDMSIRKRELRQYLKTNKIHMELAMRITQYAAHALEKRSTNVALDNSILSAALLKELYMDRRGPMLTQHSVFAFVKEAYPEMFTHLCAALQLTAYDKGEYVFLMHSASPGLYIVGPGDLTLHQNREIEKRQTSECTFFAELSLYMPLVHTMTLECSSINDVFVLSASELVHNIRDYPRAGAFFYQYARALLDQLKANKCELVDEISQATNEACCRRTAHFQVFNLSSDLELPSVTLHIDNTTSTSGNGAEVTSILQKGSWANLNGNVLVNVLERVFPELHPELGTYALYSEDSERRRALTSMVSVLWLVEDRYDDFILAQPLASRMSPSSWQKLQEFMTWTRTRVDHDSLHALLFVLAIRGLGRVRNIVLQLPESCQQQDAAVLHLLEHHQNLIPSAQMLNDSMLRQIRTMLQMQQLFMLGQFMQAESSPVTVECLNDPILNKDSPLQLFLLFALALMCGLVPASPSKGSAFMDENNVQNILLALQALRELGSKSSQRVYWNYICNRGRLLNMPLQSADDLAFVRLSCLCRVQTSKEAGSLRSIWVSLSIAQRSAVADCFLADAASQNTLMFQFLPACLANAKQNNALGLSYMIYLLVELIDALDMRTRDREHIGEVIVDLSDLAAFASAVQAPHVFETCLSRSSIVKKPHGLQLNLTLANWSKVDSVEGLGVGNCLKESLSRRRRLSSTTADKSSENANGIFFAHL